ncbi:hypothetical protein [Streptomyces sp. H34-S4]|uniref:hypothetical protein n=1 Tax=Streptomyces sp. H34-S4 TaxID=2996463 RepID=UPI003B63E4F6
MWTGLATRAPLPVAAAQGTAVALTEGGLIGFDPREGSERWRVELPKNCWRRRSAAPTRSCCSTTPGASGVRSPCTARRRTWCSRRSR